MDTIRHLTLHADNAFSLSNSYDKQRLCVRWQRDSRSVSVKVTFRPVTRLTFGFAPKKNPAVTTPWEKLTADLASTEASNLYGKLCHLSQLFTINFTLPTAQITAASRCIYAANSSTEDRVVYSIRHLARYCRLCQTAATEAHFIFVTRRWFVVSPRVADSPFANGPKDHIALLSHKI